MNSTQKIIGRECRFITHIYKGYNRPDTHLIKEKLHYENGTTSNNLKIVSNFKRPFWITSPHYQNHNDKKEYEYIEKLTKHEATQSDLTDTIARLTNRRNTGLKQLANNQYLYGTDITSSTLIKKKYMDNYPTLNTPYSVAQLDFETDTENDNTIVMGTITFNNKVITVIDRSIFGDIESPDKKILTAFKKYIPDVKIRDNIVPNVVLVDCEIDIVRELFKQAHIWSPDFMAIWSISFDVSRIIDACDRAKVDIKTILCDPSIAKEYRHFKYIESGSFKMSSSEKRTAINFEDMWHRVECSSSFYFIDAMCAYARIRASKPKVINGYSLDNILAKELSLGKLKFNMADGKHGIDWHRFMLKNYPIEYTVYNQWDTISMALLEKKTKDLSVSLPVLSEVSEFKIFNSQPKQIMNILYFYLLERGKVLGSTPANPDSNFELTLSKKNWIVVLPSHLIVNNGLKVVEELPELPTNIRGYVYDIDAISSYPSNTKAANVSKETTSTELVSIEGIDIENAKIQNINLIASNTNSIRYCTTMFNMPSLTTMLDEYKNK